MTISTPAPAVPQVAINDIGSAEDFLAAVDATIKYFNDGDIVEGTIVKVDRDEVLLDIGYKTEGVIPSRELSIKHDVDPNEVVSVGDEVEALVLTKEDKEGRLILSKKRAQYERAWGTILDSNVTTLIAGVALWLQPAAPQGTLYESKSRCFYIPGSAMPLALILGIFLTKYLVGVELALQPALARDSGFALQIAALYGVFNGLFAARALRLWKLVQRSAPLAPSPATA